MLERLYNMIFCQDSPTPEHTGPLTFEKVEDEYQTVKITNGNGKTIFAKYWTEDQMRRAGAPGYRLPSESD